MPTMLCIGRFSYIAAIIFKQRLRDSMGAICSNTIGIFIFVTTSIGVIRHRDGIIDRFISNALHNGLHCLEAIIVKFSKWA